MPWTRQSQSASNRTIDSAASIGRNQQHVVSIFDGRAQVASERCSVQIQKPARRELTILDTKLCECRKLLTDLRENFSQTIDVERDRGNVRAAASNSKEFHLDRRQSDTTIERRTAFPVSNCRPITRREE